MKMIKYLESWFEVGTNGVSDCKFAAGRSYPVTDETTAHAARGIAEEVDVIPEGDDTEATADEAADAASATPAREDAGARRSRKGADAAKPADAPAA